MAFELTGYIAAEARGFPQSGTAAEQHDENVSLVLQPELYHEWGRGDHSILFTPFLRLDQGDPERTHFDVRELFYLHAARSWELRLGAQKVFWGVTESQHLIDILNQTDLVENSDGEDKLGQPMARLTWIPSWWTLDLFLMTGFRTRTFPGPEGRLRTPIPIDTDQARYESSAEEWHLDWAARWSGSVGIFDLGVGFFSGNSREPRLLADLEREGGPRLVPFYDLIQQASLDLQATTGGWLWKLEALRRSGGPETYYAAVAGFEYTLVGLAGGVTDLGLLLEYHGDDRGEDAPTPFEDDVFVGGRLALNDVQSTSVLAGAILDRKSGAAALLVEGSRRLGDRWTLSLEFRGVTGTESDDPLHGVRRDDYVQLELARYF